MKIKYYLLAFLIGLFSDGFALQKMYVFYINGIQNSQDEARRNAWALDNTLNLQSNMINNNSRVAILYNKEGRIDKQTADVYLQKGSEKFNLNEYIHNQRFLFGIKDDRDEEAEIRNIIFNYFADSRMGNNFSDLQAQLAKQIGQPNPQALTNFIRQNSIATDYQNPYILFIPHSQGNLYANNLYQLLRTQYGYTERNLAIYGVASPAAKNLGNYISRNYYQIPGTNQPDPGYVTFDSDKIINALRGNYNSVVTALSFFVVKAMVKLEKQEVLPGNLETDAPIWSQNHSLIDSYLANVSARQRITSGVNNVLHYFWLSNIYTDPVAPANQRQLVGDVKVLAMQEPASSLRLQTQTQQDILDHGRCDNVAYFTARDNRYDERMGEGIQCALQNKGTYNLVAREFQNSNQIKLLFNGRLEQMSLTNTDDSDAEPYCATQVNWTTLAHHYFSGIVAGTLSDRSCEMRFIHDPILSGSSKADQFNGVVGKLIID